MKTSLQKLVDAMAYPVALINQNNEIVAINREGKELLGLRDPLLLPRPFGLTVKCYNALTYGVCGTTVFCEQCQLGGSIDYLQKYHEDVLRKQCMICKKEGFQERTYSISFTAKYLKYDASDYVVVTFHGIEPSGREGRSPDRPGGIDAELKRGEMGDDSLGRTGGELMETALFETMFQRCHQGILLIDSQGELVTTNRKVKELSGMTDETLKELWRRGELISIETTEGHLFPLSAEKLMTQTLSDRARVEGRLAMQRGGVRHIQVEPLTLETSTGQREHVLMIEDRGYEENQTTESLYYEVIEMSPAESYLVNSRGEILYANQTAREENGWLSAGPITMRIYQLSMGKDQEWWEGVQRDSDIQRVKYLQLIHTNYMGESYPVEVQLHRVVHRGTNLYFYFAKRPQSLDQQETLDELKVNNSLSEISRELSFSDNFSSVALLVRQYAMEITGSLFCFLTYHDPDTMRYETTIYTDTEEPIRTSVEEMSDALIRTYNMLYLNGSLNRHNCQQISKSEDPYEIEDRTVHSYLPFRHMAWVGVFFHNDFQGLLFVSGKESGYTKKDLRHLESLSNLFGLAVNRIEEKAKLLETNSRLSLAMKVSQMGMFELYLKEGIVWISSHLNQLLSGETQEQRLSLEEVKQLFHPEDRAQVITEYEHLKNGQIGTAPIQLRMAIPGKSYRWYLIHTIVMRRDLDGYPHQIVGVQMDIHDQIEATEALRQSREEAITANKSKSSFLARVSHELRTPLNAIIGFTDLLSANIVSPTQLEYLDGVRKSGHTLMELINDVLDFSKIEAGKLQIQRSETDLLQLINDIKGLFKAIVKEKNLLFEVETSESLPQYVEIDELRVKQILINLIGNAVKFTPRGFVKLQVMTEMRMNETLDLVFRVEDSGIGITASSQKLIFSDFTQLDAPDNRRFGGTGLGLGIVKRLVELMGGFIELRSEPNRGSEFIVILPGCMMTGVPKVDGETMNGTEPEPLEEPTNWRQERPGETDIAIFKECVGALWIQLSEMPTFKLVDPIVEKIRSQAHRYESAYYLNVADELVQCKTTYNVVGLSKLIEVVDEWR